MIGLIKLLGAAIAVVVGGALAVTVAFATVTSRHPDTPQKNAQGVEQGPQPVTEEILVYGRR